MATLNIHIEVKDGGVIEVAFPDADIIELESGPAMGFRCDAQMAMYIGASITHAAFACMENKEEEEEEEADE